MPSVWRVSRVLDSANEALERVYVPVPTVPLSPKSLIPAQWTRDLPDPSEVDSMDLPRSLPMLDGADSDGGWIYIDTGGLRVMYPADWWSIRRQGAYRIRICFIARACTL